MSGDVASDVFGMAEQLFPLVRGRDVRSPNRIYVGTALAPGGQRREQVFVKIFPTQFRRQLVFNEVIAYHMAVQLELPSLATFPCACRASLVGEQTESKYVLGVATVDGKPKRFKQVGSASLVKWEDVMNWPYVAHVAVFDELLGNVDRHIENLIRYGERDYFPIDHERIFFAEERIDGDLDDLCSRRCEPNALAGTIAEATDQVMRQRMLHVAQRYVMEHMLFAPGISHSLESLCGLPNGTTDKLVDMLNKRRVILPTLMQWHLQKGDLFRASTYR
jgi:hypothetical protein